MKTQKIALMGIERGKLDIIEVPATIVDVGSEFTTFVHKNHKLEGWAVSEQSTGNIITTGRTRRDAIDNATGKVREVGRDGMRIAVEQRRTYLTSCNVTLV